MGRMGKLAGIGAIAALCLPPVMIAVLGLALLDRERRRGRRQRDSTAAAVPPR